MSLLINSLRNSFIEVAWNKPEKAEEWRAKMLQTEAMEE